MTPSVCLLGFLHSDPVVLHRGGARQGPRASPVGGSRKGDQVKIIWLSPLLAGGNTRTFYTHRLPLENYWSDSQAENGVTEMYPN